MNAILQPIKENMALFCISAVIFIFVGYLLGAKSQKTPPQNPELEGVMFGIHFFGRGIEPKVITNKGLRVEPHKKPKPRPARTSTAEGTIFPANVAKGEKFADHEIHVTGTNGSIRWDMWIDNTYYCFLFDDYWNYIGLC